MDIDLTQFRPHEGMNVYGSDGEKVGEVDAVEQDVFVVRKGFFFPEDHFIPRDAVANFDEENIWLAYTKEQALEQDWTTAPEATAETTTLAGTQVGNRDADLAEVSTSARPGRDAGYDAAASPEVDAAETDAEHVSVPLHEEELVAKRRQVERGEVEIEKDVVEEQQSIDVPVTEEHVQVTQRDVDREATPGDRAFEEGTIEVPVSGEEVDVEKRTRVTGEIDIDKTAEQRTKRVSDTVRREEVTVDGDVDETTDVADTTRRSR